jgi:hypothetical protein
MEYTPIYGKAAQPVPQPVFRLLQVPMIYRIIRQEYYRNLPGIEERYIPEDAQIPYRQLF